MSIEPNKELVPISVYREPPAGNQPAAWYPALTPVRPYSAKPSRILSLSNEPATRRYALCCPPFYSRNEIHSELSESAYTSSRRLEAPKMNQVGLLIDIYA